MPTYNTTLPDPVGARAASPIYNLTRDFIDTGNHAIEVGMDPLAVCVALRAAADVIEHLTKETR